MRNGRLQHNLPAGLGTTREPRVLDLFAGCGGMSLGFHREGFRVVGAVEFDPLAARSHAQNFYRNCDPVEFGRHAAARDITRIDPEELADELGLMPGDVDVVIGGPPCQSVLRPGRTGKTPGGLRAPADVPTRPAGQPLFPALGMEKCGPAHRRLQPPPETGVSSTSGGDMGIAQYVDGILNLLEAAGVSQGEMDENHTAQKLSHAYTNGVDFEVAARELCRQHGMDIVNES